MPDTAAEISTPSSREQLDVLAEFKRGLWTENPVFRQLLGLCPTLAVTNSAINGLAMGLATTFVLISSSFIVSLIRKLVPNQVRIATFTVIIATFVTVAELFLAALFPPISKALGPYVPLIVVNCIILGRQEAFASKNPPLKSILDALVMGCGFIATLTTLGIVREILGSGMIFGVRILGSWFKPWLIMILPAGAFLSLGIGLGIINHIVGREKG
ncbi:electron transport complex subunit RsxE [candidate division KSB3 bacterium]|uniref:Ion-translocating oxidoreductase complex subunit E n=1 Tax=candidate division KSB3 bacterium TaxID=2044937 RepID=A0A2G6E634_9BACT|nr:MAG: electron transport complex subunit RsxE [candidate division KSB3 bacterium]PIE29925.1 MAG: electron transport complex subunit RsxE [candidate division KSB3 bacterium]